MRNAALLEFRSFSDFGERLPGPPDGLAEPLWITRYGWDAEHDEYVAFDRLAYYPGQAGAAGSVFYEGLVNGRSEYDGAWYPARPGAEALLEAARFSAARNTSRGPLWAPSLAILGGTAVALMLSRRARFSQDASRPLPLRIRAGAEKDPVTPHPTSGGTS